MTQAVLTKPVQTKTPSPTVTSTPPTPVAATVELGVGRQIISKIRQAPWMLALLAPIGAAPLYVAYDSIQVGFGMALASVPILAAAAFLLTGMLTCVFFLDESH